MRPRMHRRVPVLLAVVALTAGCSSSKPSTPATRPIDHALAACRHMNDQTTTSAEASAKYDGMLREATAAAQGDQRWQSLFEAIRDERDYHLAVIAGRENALGFTTVVRQVQARCADVPGSGVAAPSG